MSGERLDERVARAAERWPQALAVVADGGTYDYAELDGLASRVARQLAAAGCAAGDRVALLAPKSPRAIAAMLGVLRRGALFVPLDAAAPAARIARILRSCECRVLVAGNGTGERLRELAAAGALGDRVAVGSLTTRADFVDSGAAIDFDWRDVEAQPAERPEAGGGEIAQILYTSGSTGEPKGVAVRHASVLAFVDWAVAHFGIEAGERLSGHSPLHFDLSTFDLFGAFTAGAELHLMPPELNLLPHRLLERIRRSELTQWFSVPSVLTYCAGFDLPQPGDLPSLRRLLWCGEVFPTRALRHWMARLPHVRFTNLYGPTETTIASSYHDLDAPPADDREPVPIGVACPGEELAVLDDQLRPLPAGEVGELCIRGVGLSPGYWNDPERTAAVFRPDPAASEPAARVYRTGDLARVDERGRFHLLGRVDSQIKSRGYRIELGEIETALAATGLTREAVVTAVPTDGFEGHQICCAYAPANGDAVTPRDLKRELAQLVPGYMIPARWLTLERLPRNGSGKLDRRAVRETFSGMRRHGTAETRSAARV